MAARRVSAAEYAAQRDACTKEQLNLLAADPAFQAWQERKATRGRVAAAAANTALAVGCVLLVLALALLRPAPTAAPHQVCDEGAEGWCRLTWTELLLSALLPPSLCRPLTPLPPRSPAALPSQALPVTEPSGPIVTPTTALPIDASATLGACEPSPAAEQLEELRRQLGAARQEAEAATTALADRDLQLRSGLAARPAEAQLVEQAEAAQTAAQQLRAEKEQLAADKQRLATENRQLAADKLRLASAHQRATTEKQQLAADQQRLATENQRLTTENRQLAAAAAAAASLTEATASVAMAALGDVPAAAPAALSALLPPQVVAALSGPAPAAYAILAAMVVAALAVVLLLRSRRAAAAHAAHAAALAARLKETAFARDTAEKSLELLEGELQHRMKQLGDAQQRAADAGGLGGGLVLAAKGGGLAWAGLQCCNVLHLSCSWLACCTQSSCVPCPSQPAASPRIGTAPQPPPAHTPGKGELPPPPASLVEKFLADHNFMAVQQDQMQVGGTVVAGARQLRIGWPCAWRQPPAAPYPHPPCPSQTRPAYPRPPRRSGWRWSSSTARCRRWWRSCRASWRSATSAWLPTSRRAPPRPTTSTPL